MPGVDVRHEVGCRIDKGLPAIDLRLLAAESFQVEYFDSPEPPGVDAAPVEAELADTARVMWIGPPRPGLEVGRCAVRVSATFTPDAPGVWRLGLESAGRSVLRLDGQVVVDNTEPTRGTGFYGAGSEPVEAECTLQAGRAYALSVEVWPRSDHSPILGARILADRPVVDDEFARAVASAAASDVAVVVVGSNGQWESEGHDRVDLSLPGRQRELVEAVLAANPRTVVVVNGARRWSCPGPNGPGRCWCRGTPARRGPTRWPKFWSGRWSRQAGCRSPSRCASRTGRPAGTSGGTPGWTGGWSTERARSSATGTTRRRAWRPRSASGMGCRTATSCSTRWRSRQNGCRRGW